MSFTYDLQSDSSTKAATAGDVIESPSFIFQNNENYSDLQFVSKTTFTVPSTGNYRYAKINSILYNPEAILNLLDETKTFGIIIHMAHYISQGTYLIVRFNYKAFNFN